MRYDTIKAGALGNLRMRLTELVGRTSDDEDRRLLEQVRDRLDALAGDFAYNEVTGADRAGGSSSDALLSMNCLGCGRSVEFPGVPEQPGWVSLENLTGWTAPPLLCPECSSRGAATGAVGPPMTYMDADHDPKQFDRPHGRTIMDGSQNESST